MIFPFVDYVARWVSCIIKRKGLKCGLVLLISYLFRFQEQSELQGCKPGDFQMALEEAFLADQGFTEKLMHDIHLAADNPTFDDSFYRGIQETAGSNQDLFNKTPSQASASVCEFVMQGVPFHCNMFIGRFISNSQNNTRLLRF